MVNYDLGGQMKETLSSPKLLLLRLVFYSLEILYVLIIFTLPLQIFLDSFPLPFPPNFVSSLPKSGPVYAAQILDVWSTFSEKADPISCSS